MTVTDSGCLVSPRRAHISGGVLRLGPGDWEAQGSVRPLVEDIHEFEIDAYEVTEARYLECEAARACAPLDHSGEPGRAVSLVSNDEAARFCVWAGGSLPTSSELAFAAGGASSRRYPWGDTGAVCRRAAWGLADGPCGEGATGPELAGSHPDGASPDGVYDLAGNVAEWTLSTDPRADRADVRGGSFRDGAAAALRSWSRRTVDLANAAHRVRSVDIGFRCVYRSAAPSTPDSDAAKDRDRVH